MNELNKKQVTSPSHPKEAFSNKDLALLNDLHAALQHEKHHKSFMMITMLLIFLIIFVIWAWNSSLEEVTRGQGSIIPSSREQIIQTLDAGILKSMEVKEGDIVEKGQVLLTLDDTRSSAILRESEVKVDNLEAIRARLKAEAYSIELKFPEGLATDLVERETTVYNIRKEALESGIDNLQKSKALLDREIAITRPIVAQGAMSAVELLRMERQSADIQSQINEKKNKYLTEASAELVKTEAELAQARENMAGRADPVERALIRAPLRGIVKNIRINTVGGVISAGQDIMEIVPLEDQLLVEAYISPRDVAYVRTGMPALVKLTAYDYAIYGGLEGVVTLVSPDTLHDQKRPSDLKLNQDEAFYRVLVTTQSSHLTDKNGKELPVIPGMIASVDIKTGEKTVFQYLIKPITRMKQALQER
ncbi:MULTISPECIES: HlyD family type I secretion periplasmic adaptor subunit [Proteus]|uniref:HlyD family type I secretion periplasmic adaptor subunit n=1 Tax=Proteus TaxID=583 RepID=UPI001377FBA0|nr:MULTISPECIES: HlyD family type I secretion periplasmic adaptor subunit [Proteus]MCO8052082.1 HlyD family type I secretion periplasmic adaptor subunit [Proteus penneri]MCX2587962.1 HlyD family type I secretion periplasmic adaptor subunit [Proteus penneri]NBL79225.1 HlyD family type I secretion periplasmic adaptor subunit [Proteus sp. G2672]NBL88882.1 HlyD family type I secretion periplasmic adaptor subunit [Proteus sp. G2673]NBM02482.1 HlyD family type I secretion periplasmic adaptor subunit